MKKILILILLVLCCTGSVLGGKFEETLKKAEQGDASAQGALGYMYAIGEVVPKDEKQSVYWYKKAAENGGANAQFNLGSIYHYGYYGISQDYKKAIKWYKMSAKQGEIDAFSNLGQMYCEGTGVPQDYSKAVELFKEGAELDNGSCQYSLARMYRQGKGVAQDYAKAIYWYRQAYTNKLLNAPFEIATIYYNGEGGFQNYKKAIYWYKKAIEEGYIYGHNNIGQMYHRGYGVPQDYKQAVYWWNKAAKQGNASAQYNLGNMYYNGKGVTQNYKLAYIWESLAAAQGDEKAIKNRDIISKRLSSQQLAEAQELAAKIQNKIDHPTETQEKQSSIRNTERKVNGSGTGFIITKDGYILTCHHVIKDANEIKIAVGGKTYPATLVRDDPSNDLALLKINGSFSAIAFSSNRSAKMGQEVFTIGYPNPSLQGVNAKITKGIINSLTGFQDDLRLYQISVPVQPGNSGGALVDEKGNVLGVVMAMLDAKTTFKISGSLPQNVNYAVKSTYAQAMLDTLPEISDKLLDPSRSKSNAINRVKKSTVMVLSYK